VAAMVAEIIIITNGPGEVATWVKPVVRQLRSELPTARLTVALVPCPHASGHERRTIESWEQPIKVWSPTETVRYLLGGKKPTEEPFGDFGVVLFLGGDQAFAVMMANRTGFPLFVYTETTGRWSPWVERFLASDRRAYLALRNRRVSPRKLAMVGNLMVDAVRPNYDPNEARQSLGLSSEAPVVGLLPGSKPLKVRFITPLLLRAAELIWEEEPATQFVLHQSPFTPLSEIAEALADESLHAVTGGTGGRLVTIKDQPYIFTKGGAQIRVLGPEHHYPGMAIADLALTVPGTNTAELAILGVPMIVALPLNRPEEIPVDGLAGQIGNLPLIGKPIKRMVVRLLANRLKYISLPNQRAQRMITPELKGVIGPEEVADLALALLADSERRRAIRLDLYQAMGYPGAAAAIVSILRESLANAARHTPKLLPPAPQEQQESN
jgi:lipid-A-disaccharide synthase